MTLEFDVLPRIRYCPDRMEIRNLRGYFVCDLVRFGTSNVSNNICEMV